MHHHTYLHNEGICLLPKVSSPQTVAPQHSAILSALPEASDKDPVSQNRQKIHIRPHSVKHYDVVCARLVFSDLGLLLVFIGSVK